MGGNVGDDDGTSRTPHISLPCTTCSTLPYPILSCFVCLFLEINVEEVMHNKLFSLSSEPCTRTDQTRALEPMRSTLPNTDQPRIPHSEYHYNGQRKSQDFSVLMGFPRSDDTRNPSAKKTQKKLETFWPNYRLSIVILLVIISGDIFFLVLTTHK